MADPITVAIATAVVGKAAESLTGQISKPVAALIARIKDRFGDRPAELAIIEAAGPEQAAALAELLQAEMDADPSFGIVMRTLWQQAATVNIVQGNIGKLIQVHDVHGDLNVN
jgi:hypothetical protein